MSRTVFVLLFVGCLSVAALAPTGAAFAAGEHEESVCSDVADIVDRLICKIYCDLLDCTSDAPFPPWKDLACQRWGDFFEQRTGERPPCEGLNCTPADCDDGNACTIDACVNGACVHTDNPDCDNGDGEES
jgi:hypothetical protein